MTEREKERDEERERASEGGMTYRRFAVFSIAPSPPEMCQAAAAERKESEGIRETRECKSKLTVAHHQLKVVIIVNRSRDVLVVAE